MVVEYLGQIGYMAETCVQGFLISTVQTIDKLRYTDKKIVLLGIGENGFYAERLLNDIGIEFYAYADNAPRFSQNDCTLRGKTVYSPYDLFDRDDIFCNSGCEERY